MSTTIRLSSISGIAPYNRRDVKWKELREEATTPHVLFVQSAAERLIKAATTHLKDDSDEVTELTPVRFPGCYRVFILAPLGIGGALRAIATCVVEEEE